MSRMFGTDGVRGIANKDLTCDLAFKLGQAAVRFLGKTILVGKDTRLSGDMLESAVFAGITSMGGTALSAGIIPTPGVAFLVGELHADGGIVISASHNPPAYNGIKYFDGQGFKLPDAVEDEIEAFITAGGAQPDELPNGDEVGVILPVDDACELYLAHAVDAVQEQGIDFDGMKVALDAGHGASALTSREALERLGAEVVAINEDFDGTDINVKCGSTNLEPLKALVKATGAEVGIAHDGDADRVMMVSADGDEIDGDMMEAVLAIDMKQRGCLPGNTSVSTVMCNLGFTKALREAGIDVVQTKVGDRYVLECMRENGYALGGEQSGHMILLEHNSTGDGLMTAVQFLAAARRMGKTAGQAAAVMTRFPQELINVRVSDKAAVLTNDAVADAVKAAEQAMGETGRVLLRPSGTEPLVRVMVEAATPEEALSHAQAIAAVVEQQLGL
ncbi:MAG: phosphoglucosamine mutase [Coriobacteriia bacterium]|nr:phosphoglucosamine mutase [Coriobacteriia bacterium]